jgi:hypothetical protein
VTGDSVVTDAAPPSTRTVGNPRHRAEAWTAYAAGGKSQALEQMQAAADREDVREKHPAMENRLWPMRKLLEELLLAMNRPTEAPKRSSATIHGGVP